VLGFGSDTPAFMLIRTRTRRLAEVVGEETDA
jgi:hypothetical protein